MDNDSIIASQPREISVLPEEIDVAKENIKLIIKSAKTAKTHAQSSTANAETAKANADSTNIYAQNAKNNSETATADAQVTKENADAAIADAKEAKHHAESSASSAETAKTNADNTVAHAQAAKNSLEATITDAKVAKENADIATTNAETAQSHAKLSIDSADLAKKNADDTAISSKNAKDEAEEATQARIKAQQEAAMAAQAHNLSTTVGLAGAFNKKARLATKNLYIWNGTLGTTLLLIFIVGSRRFDKVLTLIEEMIRNNAILSVIGVEIFFLISNIAPLLWFAWLSTKMISKYFHLAEDYAYKAAISQAYIGFKEQANGLDPIFQERLFAAAITQLDANPIRFFESSANPASPLQDLLQQPFIQSALEEPSFKEGITAWMKKIFKMPLSKKKSESISQPET